MMQEITNELLGGEESSTSGPQTSVATRAIPPSSHCTVEGYRSLHHICQAFTGALDTLRHGMPVCRHSNCSRVTPQPIRRRETVTLCKGFNISAGHRVKLIIYDSFFFTSVQLSADTIYVKGENSVFS